MTEDDADGFRRCGRDDDHEAHAWASWMHYDRGTAVQGRQVCRYYWCDGRPPDA